MVDVKKILLGILLLVWMFPSVVWAYTSKSYAQIVYDDEIISNVLLNQRRIVLDNGQSATSVYVNPNQLISEIERLGWRDDTIQIICKNTEGIIVEFSGSIMEELDGMIMEIKTDTAIYRVPINSINIKNLVKLFGKVDPNLISVKIKVISSDRNLKEIAQTTAKNKEHILISDPVEFSVQCTCEGEIINLNEFSTFIEKLLPIPNYVESSTVTTGVLVRDWTYYHVPTKTVFIDEEPYASIKNLFNGPFCLINNPKTFLDMDGHWAKSVVEEMTARLVMSGVDGEHFAPNAVVSRADMAFFLVQALNLRLDKDNMNSFSDVKNTDWFYRSVYTIDHFEIIKGFGDGTFLPNDPITKEEAIGIIFNAFKFAGFKTNISTDDIRMYLSPYQDSNSILNWHRPATAFCLKHHIITGYNGLINPKKHITRAECAKMIWQMLKANDLI